MRIPRPLSQSLLSLRRQALPCGYASRWMSASREQPLKDENAKTQGLPAPGEGEGIQLDVSGEGSSVSLGHLGPLVVNRDGTTGRVTNWEAMTVHEKQTTLQLLKKRNKARLDALKGKEESGSKP